tara:strand:+ start:656 stop:1258 length:603 start_codon:yes stop_codon:yes gene_type:complete
MKRILEKAEKINFIGSWLISNDHLFDNIIDFFENNKSLHSQGSIDNGINLEDKKTIDLSIDPIDLKDSNYQIFNVYFDELFKCFQDYKQQWPFINENIKTLDIPTFNVQRYLSGDHFSKIHTERSSTSTSHRVFAWMTYLNNIDENAGGCTNFHHFNLKVQPKKGKTLIWPAEWTHAHSGEILNTGKKYIITGWLCFPFN